jgi:hypothetical protein
MLAIPPFGPQHRTVGPSDPAVFGSFRPPGRYGLRAVGVRPAQVRIMVGSARLDVRFGPWRVATQRGNVAGAEPSGPLRWRWVGACYSAAEHRLVLSSSRHGAVCLSFDRPVVCVPRRADPPHVPPGQLNTDPARADSARPCGGRCRVRDRSIDGEVIAAGDRLLETIRHANPTAGSDEQYDNCSPSSPAVLDNTRTAGTSLPVPSRGTSTAGFGHKP